MARDDRAGARLDAFAHPRYSATPTAAPDELERAVHQVARDEPYLSGIDSMWACPPSPRLSRQPDSTRRGSPARPDVDSGHLRQCRLRRCRLPLDLRQWGHRNRRLAKAPAAPAGRRFCVGSRERLAPELSGFLLSLPRSTRTSQRDLKRKTRGVVRPSGPHAYLCEVPDRSRFQEGRIAITEALTDGEQQR